MLDCETGYLKPEDIKAGHYCNGGALGPAMEFLKTQKMMSAKDYPYSEAYPMKNACNYDESKATDAQVSSYMFSESGDIDMMKKALSHQPIAAVLDSDNFTFQFYTWGIIDASVPSENVVDHTVTIVGYGNYEGTDYWLVKNSWGTDWGDTGYIKIGMKPGVGLYGIQIRGAWPVLV